MKKAFVLFCLLDKRKNDNKRKKFEIVLFSTLFEFLCKKL